MKMFSLCASCEEEYTDPLNRRFHAQPVACETCGPVLSFHDADNIIEGNEQSMSHCVEALHKGNILAIKGIGGYHLVCDACNEHAVNELRRRKQRQHKPFAVLFPWCGDDGDDIIKEHPVIGDGILKPISFFDKIRPMVRSHHERMDGKGYPDGMPGKDMSTFIRIMVVADSYDAMASDRPYRKRLSKKKIIEELENNSNSQFDPDIAHTMIQILNEDSK